MKNFILFVGTIVALSTSLRSNAQVSVNVNFGAPPLWGVYGYDDARYYYLPDMGMYYDIWEENFIYFDGGGWIYSGILPHRYGHFDLFNCYKVVLNYNGYAPYRWHDHHHDAYAGYRGYHGPRQQTYNDHGGRPYMQANVHRGNTHRDHQYRGNNSEGDYRGSRNTAEGRPPQQVGRPSENVRNGQLGNVQGRPEGRPERQVLGGQSRGGSQRPQGDIQTRPQGKQKQGAEVQSRGGSQRPQGDIQTRPEGRQKQGAVVQSRGGGQRPQGNVRDNSQRPNAPAHRGGQGAPNRGGDNRQGRGHR